MPTYKREVSEAASGERAAAIAARGQAFVSARVRSICARVDMQWLWLLFAADLAFMLLHIAHRLWLPAHQELAITTDQGYAEVYQYVKTFWVVLLLGKAAVRHHSGLWLWCVTCLYLLLDDSLCIHEALGQWVWRESTFLLHVEDHIGLALGELAFFLAVGTAVMALIVLALRLRLVRWIDATVDLTVMLALFAVCSVGIDFVHAAIFPTRMNTLFSLAEDGGELVVMSLIAAYSVGLARARAAR